MAAPNREPTGHSTSTVRSKDGTPIAFDWSGEGPAIILVVGAFNDRATGAPLAAHLAERFTVFTYDRRGRGLSGDTAPYAVMREVEDLEGLITEAEGAAGIFGYSSGGILDSQSVKTSQKGPARLRTFDPPRSLFSFPFLGVSHRIRTMRAAGRF